VLGGPRSSASLEQVFLNLLLNAAAALGPGGKAWLEARQTSGEVIVCVRDAGTGIPEEVLIHVFEPLYSTRTDGTGLGLAVARRIVEDHQGRIELQSRVGSGTTVRVSLPPANDASHDREVEV
jgi:two-component system, sporulation sensor kinase E